MKIIFLIFLVALATPAKDQEIFERAHALWDQGQQVEALKACKELIKNYPTSKYVPDAYLMFGEFYFDHAKIEKALMAYKKVTEFKDSKVYSYALYKTGWCYFNIQEFEKALATFVSVVKYETGRQSSLRREALNDTVLTYGHAGKASAAPAFFARLAPQEVDSLLVKLGGIYFGYGKFKEALFVYRHLLSKVKCSPQELVYQQKIIDCTLHLGNKKLTVKETGRLVVMFGQLENCLVNPTTRQQEILTEARQETEGALFALAVAWKEEAEATKDPDALQQARKVAEHYLELFPNHSRAREIRGLIR